MAPNPLRWELPHLSPVPASSPSVRAASLSSFAIHPHDFRSTQLGRAARFESRCLSIDFAATKRPKRPFGYRFLHVRCLMSGNSIRNKTQRLTMSMILGMLTIGDVLHRRNHWAMYTHWQGRLHVVRRSGFPRWAIRWYWLIAAIQNVHNWWRRNCSRFTRCISVSWSVDRLHSCDVAHPSSIFCPWLINSDWVRTQ